MSAGQWVGSYVLAGAFSLWCVAVLLYAIAFGIWRGQGGDHDH